MAALLDPDRLLGGLHPATLRAVRKLARRSPFPLQVRSGRRTCAEQRELYGIGRRYNTGSAPVTYADGCRSWHVLGRAVDLFPLDPSTGSPLVSCNAYGELGLIWEEMGGVWGGRFSGFGPCGDAGHFEWHPGASIEDFCPDPSACDSVEAQIDRQIGLSKVTNIGLASVVLAAGGAAAWYIWRQN